MAKASTKTQATTVKRKRWYELIAPRLFNEQVLGETLSAEPEQVIGRAATINLMNLTKDIKKQNINVTFRVQEVTGLKAHTDLIEYHIIPTSIKRLVRKGKEKVEDSFLAVTKDNRTVRVKPLIICRSNTVRSVSTDVKEATRKMTEEILKQIDYYQFIKDIITQKFQRALRQQVNKIYPVKIVDIRMIKLIK